jgi:hypothetical protein
MIELFDGYGIDTDERNFTITETKPQTNKKTGEQKPFTANLGYYSSMKNALNGLMHILQRRKLQEKVYTLAEAIVLFEHIESDFEKLLSKVKENMPV